MSRPVPPTGPLDARLVFVGRDPGFEESQRGEPFVGAAGRLLDRALSSASIPRERCLITNVVDVQPPGNKWEAHDPKNVARGVRSLHALLTRHPRAMVVPLGNEAFTAVMGKDPWTEQQLPITEARGYPFVAQIGTASLPVLPTVHPAFVMRNWHPWWALLQWDLAKAKRLADGGWPGGVRRIQSERYTLLSGEADRVVWDAGQAATVAIDIETAQSGAPVCVGVSWRADQGLTLPLPAFTKQAKQLLAQPNRKVLHNAQFDLTLLQRAGYAVAGEIADTMLLWHTVEPLLAGKTESGRSEKSLRFLASLLLDEPWWKDYEFRSEEERWRLCAKDARITLALYELLTARIQKGVGV